MPTWQFGTNGDKENMMLRQMEATKRMEEVVSDKDEQIVQLNKMLCDVIAERDAAQRAAAAVQQLSEVNEQLRDENSQLMAQLKVSEAQIEQLELRIKSMEVAREPALSVAPPSVSPGVPYYAQSVAGGVPGRRYAPSAAGSLAASRSFHRLSAKERAKMNDYATRAMLLNK